jgi:hypothetical protein
MNSYHPKWSDISEVVQLLEECSVEPHGSHDRRLCCQIGSNWRTKSAGVAVPNIRTTLEQPGESPLLSNEAHAKYRRAHGKLAWLSQTRDDIHMMVCILSTGQAAPTERHERALRQVYFVGCFMMAWFV